MRAPGLTVALAIWFAILGAGATAHATLLRALDDDTLLRLSERVVTVEVIDVRSAWDVGHEIIETWAEARVLASHKGPALPGEVLRVRQLGGSAEGVTMVVPGSARFAVGERAELFLRRAGPEWEPVGMMQGKRDLGPPATLDYGLRKSPQGAPYRWEESCITLEPAPGVPEGVGADELHAAEWTSALTWSRWALPCTYLDIGVAAPTAAAGRVKADGHNSIVFRTKSWCRDPAPADGKCYDPAALALTSFFARDSDARIFDADIELNAVNFNWAVLDGPDDDRRFSRQDVVNTLTHEMGHLIGLDHNCHVTGAVPHNSDQHGDPLPECATAPADVRAATMFFSAPMGEISKRSLEADDVAAVCESYPAAEDPHRCEKPTLPGQGGCAVGPRTEGTGGPGGPPLRGLAIALAFFLMQRRRARPARPPAPAGDLLAAACLMARRRRRPA